MQIWLRNTLESENVQCAELLFYNLAPDSKTPPCVCWPTCLSFTSVWPTPMIVSQYQASIALVLRYLHLSRTITHTQGESVNLSHVQVHDLGLEMSMTP